MKKIITVAAVVLLAGCHQGADHKAASSGNVSLNNETSKFSYAIGLDVGKSLSRMGEKLDMDAFNAGVETSMKGEKSKLSAADILDVKKAVFKREQEKMMAKRSKQADANEKAGEAFLKKNAGADGVKTTASGLQYKVLTAGSGPKPTLDDIVKVNYEGKTIDGKVFDSSYKRGKPVTFPLKNVIAGWKEGLQLMPVGSKYRLFIPANLAYGENGAGNVIGPNSVLIFDVELLGIEKAGPASKSVKPAGVK